MSTVSHYDQGDLALFAMQLLPRSEHVAMAMHIADCTYCRQELAQLQGDLAAYSHTVEMHSPPAQVRERLLNQISREKKFSPVERGKSERIEAPLPQAEPVVRQERIERSESPERLDRVEAANSSATPSFGYPSRGQRQPTGLGSGRYVDEHEDSQETDASVVGKAFSRVFPWMGWAAAATLAIVAGNLYHQRDTQRLSLRTQASTIDRLSADAAGAKQLIDTITDPTARQVSLSKTQGTPVPAVPHGRVTYVASKGALIFLASNLDPVQTYKTYELWLIPADGRDPIPAGTFHPDAKGNASVILPPLPKGIEAKAFGITVEDDGGSQTPTMPIVMAGN
jgi:anti-sigma-K factor RskA